MKRHLLLIVFCMHSAYSMKKPSPNQHLWALITSDITSTQYSMLEQLIKQGGADPNHRDSNGISPLNWAAGTQNLKLCKLLIACGAHTFEFDQFNYKKFPYLQASALETATANNHIALCIMLLEQQADEADISESYATMSRTASCAIAKSKGFQPLFEILIAQPRIKANHKRLNGISPLNGAVGEGDYELCQFLILHGANVNKREEYLRASVCLPKYPMYCAAPLLTAVKKGSLPIIKLLLQSGADANITAFDGTTPLMLACQEDSFDTVAMLLSHNANPNLCMANGATALVHAFQKRNRAIINRLLESHAHISGPSELESTITGTLSDDLCLLLLKRGINPRTSVGPAGNPFLVELAIRIFYSPQFPHGSTNPENMIRMVLRHIANNRKKALTLMCAFHQRRKEAWAKLLYTHAKDLIKRYILAILYNENMEKLRSALADRESKTNKQSGIVRRRTAYEIYKFPLLNPSNLESTMHELWKE